jgi:transposase-like protein
MTTMGKRMKRYSKQFKDEALKLVAEGKRSVKELAADLQLPKQTLYKWIEQSKIDAGEGQPEQLTTDERAELSRLRRENQQLQLEKEFLKKAAAFFAKENN